ncbi:LuxR family transcriptional regulator [Corallococcus sp. AB049A]|uniref:LuxR C-terminal-related transcriptional regulator n=1 Tax=Corallococcus sp. AB049A TaxID=2316721 RepID=UPI000EA1BB06|nr:LuxR C-terminal-related transcriptional regulator [Corallococcus sp. AB049A]RKH50512.1 LuxR family transcriptional regulator [Corallococcus sp. AB050B]RKI74032.1 LuxR family transcriptional regulator [Corallococcus sp. AB049A]
MGDPLSHLLPTKLAPPRTASVLVSRSAALRKIDRGAAGTLVLVTAPLGSGKTTLLTQWCREVHGSRLLAWLSLDERDNAPERFFSYLVGAIRRAAPEFDAYIASPLDAQVALPLEHATTVVLRSLWNLGRELVVVLDDFHVLRERALVRAFSYLLDHAPPHVHWIVSSRSPPELDLAKLKLTEQLVTLDSRDLSLDGEAIHELGRRLCGAVLQPDDVEYLRARTEGWVAGVKLALLTAGEHASVSDALRKAVGSNHDVARYLADVVLREQTEEVHAFLVLSSVVDRLNGELCNALLGITRGPALLAELERAQLFIQSLDTQDPWYRYHPLFLDFLRTQLACTYGDRIPRLHRAASAWFAEHALPDEALTHAFASGDRGWCLELVARCAEAWMREGEIASVLQWTEKLTAEEVFQSPAICVARIACLILSRGFAPASLALQDAQRRLQTAAPAPERERLSRQLSRLALLHAVLSDSASGIELEASPGDEDPDIFMAGAVLAAKAYQALRQNRFDAMRRLASVARETLQGPINPYMVGYTDVLIVLADRAQGHMKEAVDRCEAAFERASRGRRNPVWVNAATALANTRYDQNRLDEAEALCIEVLPLLSQAAVFETFAVAYLVLARIKAIRGKYAEAWQLLDYLHSVLECGHQTRFLAHVCGEKIRLSMVEQSPARMKVVAREFDLGERMRRGEWSERRFYDETWEQLGVAQAWVLMAKGRHDRAHGLLETLRASAHEAGCVARETALLAALAVCHWRAGDPTAAFAAVNRGFALVPRFGFSRGVFDETPGLQEVIVAAATQRKLSHVLPARYTERYQDLLSLGRSEPAGFAVLPSAPLEPLTERELQMLKLLAQGLSNQEISERSNVALSTTKWHLRNVFAKLDVTTRTAAIVKARERLARNL